MKVLLTGAAGFIGYHTANILLKKNINVVCIDNLNHYYDVSLKKNRLNDLQKKFKKKFKFINLNFNNNLKIDRLFSKEKFTHVIHLGAQAGVRYSIDFPNEYHASNTCGFYNILETSKKFKIKRIIFSSSSSVYGEQKIYPTTEGAFTNKPESFYAASKVANEAYACAYSKIYNINIINLRFYTVYGPFGRPDMALFKLLDCAYNNKIFNLHNNGKHKRDFTYIDDVINIIYKLLKFKKKLNTYEVFNVCGSKPRDLKDLVEIVEKFSNKKIIKKNKKQQKGDVLVTFGSNKKVKKILKYNKFKTLEYGVKKFIKWYQSYYAI